MFARNCKNEALPAEIAVTVHTLTMAGHSKQECINILHSSLFHGAAPADYQPYPYRFGAPGDYVAKCRTVLATYIFRHRIAELKAEGRDFTMYLYIPEKDAATGDSFHDRADHCHLLKRIAGTEFEIFEMSYFNK